MFFCFFHLEVSVGADVERQLTQPSIDKVVKELIPGLYSYQDGLC